jgi:hypothetical protein
VTLMNYQPTMTPLLLQSPVLEQFTLIDVGCAGGLDPLWRMFGSRLHAHGLDAKQEECSRLQAVETNPNVRYHGYFIGVEESHSFNQSRRTACPVASAYLGGVWDRSSSAAAYRLRNSLPTNVLQGKLAEQRIGVGKFAKAQSLRDIDFIKIDLDGADLEAVVSAEEIIRPCGVLGFMIECLFTGSAHETENSFHNIDRSMRRLGFQLYNLTTERYTRGCLPGIFVYDNPWQTKTGPLFWGESIYFRDGAAPDYHKFWGEELSLPKLAKLAILYELFRMPDCAAELILAHRDRFAEIANPDQLLDALTPPLHGTQLSHSAYLTTFRQHTDWFFPSYVPPGPAAAA